MNRRLPFLGIVVSLVLAVGGTAYAYDCIRVSDTLKGLQQSTKSGNWLLFNFGSAAGAQSTFADVFESPITAQQAACFAAEYAESGEPKYFALGIGVGGSQVDNEHGNFGVLAWHNKNDKVLGDGRGVDHLEQSGIVGAAEAAAAACGFAIPD